MSALVSARAASHPHRRGDAAGPAGLERAARAGASLPPAWGRDGVGGRATAAGADA
jgi:hypothetical protein